MNLLISRIGDFQPELARQNPSIEIRERCQSHSGLRAHFSEVARLSARLPEYYPVLEQLKTPGTTSAGSFQQAVIHLIDACEVREDQAIQGCEAHQMMRQVQREYQYLKGSLPNQTISSLLNTADSVALMDALSHIHRLAEQAEKASRHWSSTTPVQKRAPLVEAARSPYCRLNPAE